MKQMNLENFGVVEMHAKEMKEVEGGDIPWGDIGKYILDHWGEIKSGLASGWADGGIK
ncbi:hypothetical protein [Mucilaginibacter lappiensis]|uniref:Uncharacterized protein n=1 Tax=Mucilaginibacter lappiensis TaxID=354630 RepID=A0A1N7CV46_9SPHI|nr:hypothetical protein [Mucilaginibacter lappiensis]MBB6111024.1 hypothetical protein [Mucilaginibacter lappiensis]MBB6128850.1 hypothetical protein [Mucilaginibacter lappiensis]SIR67482.1 hypothetical protein SAMN05421821_11042 [Mucilaginibacter lappiensis]